MVKRWQVKHFSCFLTAILTDFAFELPDNLSVRLFISCSPPDKRHSGGVSLLSSKKLLPELHYPLLLLEKSAEKWTQTEMKRIQKQEAT